MPIGYPNWKANRLIREQQEQVAAVESDAAQALADAATAQSTANTGVSDAATAQGDADDALEGVASLEATVGSVTTQTEQLFNSAGQVATPVVFIVPYSGGLQITWSCTTPSHTLYYRINGGSWTAYAGAITLSPGDTCDAYATATGLTDSAIGTYSA